MKKLFSGLLSVILLCNICTQPTAHAVITGQIGDCFFDYEHAQVEDPEFLVFDFDYTIPDYDYTYYYLSSYTPDTVLPSDVLSPVFWHSDLHFQTYFAVNGSSLAAEDFDALIAQVENAVSTHFDESYQIESMDETAGAPVGTVFYYIKKPYDKSLTYSEAIRQTQQINQELEKAEQLFRELQPTNSLQQFRCKCVTADAAIAGWITNNSWARYSVSDTAESGAISFETLKSTLQSFVDVYAPDWSVSDDNSTVCWLLPDAAIEQEVTLADWFALCQKVYEVTGYRACMSAFSYLDIGGLQGVNIGLSGGLINFIAPDGDCTLDSTTDSADAILALEEYTAVSLLHQESTFTAMQRICADMDSDGVITAADAIAILTRYAESLT